MKAEWTAEEIAALTQGEIAGNRNVVINGAASVQEAREGDIVFAESEKYLVAALRSRATAILTNHAALPENSESEKALIVTENPRLAFVQVLEAFSLPLDAPPGIHPTALVHATAKIGATAHIAAYATVGEGAVLGERVVVMAGTHIGADCAIGDDTILHANITLYPGITIGKRCILHAGVVVGADGFGYIQVGQSLRKVPQLGTVIIHDDVEIGANACIDRAKTGATVIGTGVKMDNLVHVGHGVKVGPYSILIAQVGLGGGATIGAGVILAGQAGVVDHVTIGDGAKVGAQSGVISDIEAGMMVSGFPARNHTEKMRGYAALLKLPDYLKRIRDLEKRLNELESK